MKTVPQFLLTLAVITTILFSGCTSTNQSVTTTTQSYPTVTIPAEPGARELVQEGLDNGTITHRGFYRDSEFIILGVLQNPYDSPVSARVNYSLYSNTKLLASGQAEEGDIVNGYLPAHGLMPVKINCGKIEGVIMYRIDLDLQTTDAKPVRVYKEIDSSAEINANKVTLTGEITNEGTTKTQNTRITAILYDAGDKAIDALYAYTLPMDIPSNETASYAIQETYPTSYTDYLKKVTYYRLFAEDVYPPETQETTSTIPIQVIGADNQTGYEIE